MCAVAMSSQNQALRIIYKQDNYADVNGLHNSANLLPLKLRREIALHKIMFHKVQKNQGLQLRELTTRAHEPNPNQIQTLQDISNRFPTGGQHHGTN